MPNLNDLPPEILDIIAELILASEHKHNLDEYEYEKGLLSYLSARKHDCEIDYELGKQSMCFCSTKGDGAGPSPIFISRHSDLLRLAAVSPYLHHFFF